MLIDSHAHLDNELILDRQQQIISSMSEDNLALIINAGCNLETSKNSIRLANENEKIYAIIGIHPEFCDEYDAEFEKFLEDNLTNPKVVAVGEIGLDYHYEGFDAKKQAQVFLSQAKVANKLGLPVVVHLRDAYGDFLEIVKNNKNLFNNGMLLHCYSGSFEFAKQLMAQVENLYFAFGGSCTFKNAKQVKEAIKNIPLNRILTETDSPYLTPEPLRGREKNQPKYVSFVVQKIADERGMLKQDLEKQIEKNTAQFFKKIKQTN